MAATAIKGILKRILEPLLVGFSTKDLSLSFLGGKAKLRDIEVNVDAINEKLNQMQGVPVKFTRIHISDFAVRASMSKIKSRPVEIVLGEVLIEMEEPSVLLPPRTGRPPKPAAVSGQRYGTKDRIGDGMSVTVGRVEMVIRSKGLLKDAPLGPWTPPDLVYECFDVKLVSCDAEGGSCGGNIAELYQKLANSKATEGKTEIMVYKKATMQRIILKLIPALAKYRPQTTAQAQSSAPQNQNNKDLEPVVLLDESPAPLQVLMAMRKRRADGVLLGLLIKVEAITEVRMQLRDLRSMKMLVHVMTALTQMVNREGEIAWVNPNYLESLWAAVDAGYLPTAKATSAQAALGVAQSVSKADATNTGVESNNGKFGTRKTFTLVESEDVDGKNSMLEADLLSTDVEDDPDFEDDLEDSIHTSSSHGGGPPGLRVGGLPPVGALVEPRTVMAFDTPSLVLDFGTDRTCGLDGGLRLALRDLNMEYISNIEQPPESMAAAAGPGSALACSNCANAHKPHSYLCDSAARAGLCPTDRMQVRIGSISLSSLASGSSPLLEIAVGTPPIHRSKSMGAAATTTSASNREGLISQSSGGPALLPETPIRWLQRGIERGFDPFADATSDGGQHLHKLTAAGASSPSVSPLYASSQKLPREESKASAPYALGMSMVIHKCGLGLPFGTITLNFVADLPSPVKLCLNPALMSPLPDFFTAAVDSRWFTGHGWNLSPAPLSQPGAKSDAGTTVSGSELTSTASVSDYCGRIEPMLLGAGSVVHLRLRGGIELTIPPPQDMTPSLPGLTLRTGALALSIDRGRSRFGVLRPRPPQLLQSSSENTPNAKANSSGKDSHCDSRASAASAEEDLELGMVDPSAPLPPLLPARMHISLDGLALEVTNLGRDYRTGPAALPVAPDTAVTSVAGNEGAAAAGEGGEKAAAVAGSQIPMQSNLELLRLGHVLYVSSFDLPLENGEKIGASGSEVAESEGGKSTAQTKAIAAAWQATRVETSIDSTVATRRALQPREPQNSLGTGSSTDHDTTGMVAPTPPRPGLDQCYVHAGVPGAQQSVSVDTIGCRVCLDLPAMAAASQTVVHLVKSLALGRRTVASAVKPRVETSSSQTANTVTNTSDSTAGATPAAEGLKRKTTRVRVQNLSAWVPSPPSTGVSLPSSSNETVLSNASATELELKLRMFHAEVVEQCAPSLLKNEVAVPLEAAAGVVEGLRLSCRDESLPSTTNELTELLVLDAAVATMNHPVKQGPLAAEVQLGTCRVTGDAEPLCGAVAQVAQRWSSQSGNQGLMVPVVLCDRSGWLFSDEVTLRTFLDGALSPAGPYLDLAVPFDGSYGDGGIATEGGRDGELRRFSLPLNRVSTNPEGAEIGSCEVAGADRSLQLPSVGLVGKIQVGAIMLALPPSHAATAKSTPNWTLASFKNLRATVELAAKAQLEAKEHAPGKTIDPSPRLLSASVSATTSVAHITPSEVNGTLNQGGYNRSDARSSIWHEQELGLHNLLVAPFRTSAEISAEMHDNIAANALLSHLLDSMALEFAVSPQGNSSAMTPVIERRAGSSAATAHADPASEYESALAAAGLGFPVGRQSGETADAPFLASSPSTGGAGESEGTALAPHHQQLQWPSNKAQQLASIAALAANFPAGMVPQVLASMKEQTHSVAMLQTVLDAEGWGFSTSESPEAAAALPLAQATASNGMRTSSGALNTSPPSSASTMAYDAAASLGQQTQAARLLCDELSASLRTAQSSSNEHADAATAVALSKANEIQVLLNQAATLQERTAAAWAAHAADLTARAHAAAAAEAKTSARLAASEAQRSEDHEARRRADKALAALETRRVAEERQHKEALAALEERLNEAEKRANAASSLGAETGEKPTPPPRSKVRSSMLGSWMPSSSSS